MFLRYHFVWLYMLSWAYFTHEASNAQHLRRHSHVILPKQMSTALFTSYMQIERSRSNLLMAQLLRDAMQMQPPVFMVICSSKRHKVARVFKGSNLQTFPYKQFSVSLTTFPSCSQNSNINSFLNLSKYNGIREIYLNIRMRNFVRIRISDWWSCPLVPFIHRTVPSIMWFSSRAW